MRRGSQAWQVVIVDMADGSWAVDELGPAMVVFLRLSNGVEAVANAA
jgi:hypothetical protein